MTAFKKATRASAYLRAAAIGPAGSGKTMTMLRVARGLADGGRIAVIDTERGSASLYAGERELEFDVLELDSFEVERYIDALDAAVKARYSVVVIDSLSHAWAGRGGILEFVDKAGKRASGGGGGNFGAWRDATPRHNQLVDAILAAPLHVLCTLRSKTEYVVEVVGGRNQVRKVGLQPVQRDGLEYEFTLTGDVTQDHDFIITKTRAAFLKDAVVREAGEELGRQLLEWLRGGEPVAGAVAAPPAADADDVVRALGWIANEESVPRLLEFKIRAESGRTAKAFAPEHVRAIGNAVRERIDQLPPPQPSPEAVYPRAPAGHNRYHGD